VTVLVPAKVLAIEQLKLGQSGAVVRKLYAIPAFVLDADALLWDYCSWLLRGSSDC
jgi:hypothetical protein